AFSALRWGSVRWGETRRMTAAPFPPYGWGSVRWGETWRMTAAPFPPCAGVWCGGWGSGVADDGCAFSVLRWGLVRRGGAGVAEDGCAFSALRWGLVRWTGCRAEEPKASSAGPPPRPQKNSQPPRQWLEFATCTISRGKPMGRAYQNRKES